MGESEVAIPGRHASYQFVKLKTIFLAVYQSLYHVLVGTDNA